MTALHEDVARELLLEAKGNHDLAIVAAQSNRDLWRRNTYYWQLYRLAAQFLRQQRANRSLVK